MGRATNQRAGETDILSIDRNDTTLVLTLNRPKRRNALTVELVRALADALDSGLAEELATMGANQGGLLIGPDFQAVVDRMTGR